MAFEERAAVLAFMRMEAELRHHDAPMSLRKAARRATADERRHARVLGAIARKAGASVSQARVAKKPARTLLEIALENATEGCVRETFGAALLAYQAAHATNDAMRDAFTAIAEDESRHAALSWALASWAESKLTAEEAARVLAARAEALETLRNEIANRKATANDAEIGHPSREIAAALLDGLTARLDLS